MLITESQLNRNSANCFSLLENMEWIDDTSCCPAMVPVVENTRLNAAVIKIEDLTSYAEANGIVDLGYALQTVCEASDIDPSAVVFSVQEENIIADQDTESIVESLINEGVGVVAVPISHNRIEYKLAEAAVEYYASTGDDSLLEAYANGEYSSFLEFVTDPDNVFGANPNKTGTDRFVVGGGQNSEVGSKIPGTHKGTDGKLFKFKRMKQKNLKNHQLYRAAGGGMSPEEFKKQQAENKKNNNHPFYHGKEMLPTAGNADLGTSVKATIDKQNGSNPEAPKNVMDTDKAIKNADIDQYTKLMTQSKDKDKGWFSRHIASLNSKMHEYIKKTKEDPKNAGIFRKIASKIAQVIEWLTRRLHNLVNNKNNAIGNMPNYDNK